VKPSFRSSPWIRGAPQVRFARCISRISSRIPDSICGRPGCRDPLLQRQYNRKPCRCHRITVSGRTRTSAWRQPDQQRDSHAQRIRSEIRNRTRRPVHWRLATRSWWRRAITSAWSAARRQRRHRSEARRANRAGGSIATTLTHPAENINVLIRLPQPSVGRRGAARHGRLGAGRRRRARSRVRGDRTGS